MYLDKKANHGRLILFLAVMFVSTFVFAILLEFGFDLMGNSLTMRERVNDKFSNDFNVIAVYAFGTEDSKIDGGLDNISIIARLDHDSIAIPFKDILIELRAQNLQENYKFNATNAALTGTTYTYKYDHKGENYRDGFISKDDVINMNVQLPAGVSIPEDTYIILDIFYTKKNTNVPIRFTLPAGLIDHKTYLYP